MTLVCFALPFESAAFEKSLPPDSSVRVLHTGMGAATAVPRLTTAIEQFHPEQIILSGFAGALHPNWRAGDVFVAENLSTEDWLHRISYSLHSSKFHVGALTTAIDLVSSPWEKSALRARTGADAVDMESAALYQVAVDAGIPVLTIRSISDDAHADLVVPPTLLSAAAEHGIAGTARLMVWVLTHPARWMDFIRFVRNSKKSQSALTAILELL